MAVTATPPEVTPLDSGAGVLMERLGFMTPAQTELGLLLHIPKLGLLAPSRVIPTSQAPGPAAPSPVVPHPGALVHQALTSS